MSSPPRMRCNHRPLSISRRFWAPLIIVCLLPLTSCKRYQLREELIQRQCFAEILKRENRRWIGEDKFFENSLLAGPYPQIRQWSAIALGRIASPRALPLLYRALHAGDIVVRAASAFAIGEIEKREVLEERCLNRDPEAAAELNRLLDDPSLSVRMRAVEALGKIGSHEEAAGIVQRLEQFSYRGLPDERAFLEFSITALARLRDPAALPVLEKLARTSDPEIQWRALDALIRLQSKAAGPLFVENLKNSDPQTRSFAARGIGILGDPNLESMILPMLSVRLEASGDTTVRFGALQAIGEMKNPSVIPAIKAAMMADPINDAHPDQLNFAIQAATALGAIGTSDGEAALLPLLRFPGPVANNAVIALAKILKGNPERFFSLVDKSQFSSPSDLPVWTQAMAELGGPDAVEELNQLLEQAIEKPAQQSAETVPTIITALARTEDPSVQETLAPFLNSHDPALLRAALAAYKPKPGVKAPWAPIIQAFIASAVSSNTEARIDILFHLNPWIREEQVQQIFRGGLKDPDRNLRLACAALLRKAGAPDIAEDPGPANSSISEAFCQALADNRKNSTIAILETTRGTIEIELFREDAPVTAANFVLMASNGAYNGLEFDKVVPWQLIEGNSPRTREGLSTKITGEINMRSFEKGSVGVALSGGYSKMERFFITLTPQPYFDGVNTCFGRIISGMQVAERIVPGDRIKRIAIKETINLIDYHRYN